MKLQSSTPSQRYSNALYYAACNQRSHSQIYGRTSQRPKEVTFNADFLLPDSPTRSHTQTKTMAHGVHSSTPESAAHSCYEQHVLQLQRRHYRPGKARSARLDGEGEGSSSELVRAAGQGMAGHADLSPALLLQQCAREKGDRQTEAQSWPPRTSQRHTAIPTARNGTSASVHSPISLDSPTPRPLFSHLHASHFLSRAT